MKHKNDLSSKLFVLYNVEVNFGLYFDHKSLKSSNPANFRATKMVHTKNGAWI